MQYFGYSVNIIFVIVALLLFQRIFLFHVQFVNGMNTSYVQIRNELASEQLIKVQFQVAMSGRYRYCCIWSLCLERLCTPSGSIVLNAFLTNSLLTDNLWSTTNLCYIDLYPTMLPVPFSSSSMASAISSRLLKRRLPRLFFAKILLSCRRLRSIS